MVSISIKDTENLKRILMGDYDFHNQTSNYASHNFHSFPAKFPPQLPRHLISELTSEGDTVLDPMVGSGTTLVEALALNRKAIGFDIDPLALAIAKVKTTYIEEHLLQNSMKFVISKARERLESCSYDLRGQIVDHFDENTRAFLDNWFLPKTQSELFALSEEIKIIEDENIRGFLEVAFSSIIITKSGGVSLAIDLGHTRPHLAKKVLDSYGKTLIGDPAIDLPSYSTKIVRPALSEFEKRFQINLKGLPDIAKNVSFADIRFADAQRMPLENASVDLIVTSPPYASNAIDYMRAHKFSLVWFDYPIDKLSEKRKEYIGGESITNFVFEEMPEYPKIIIERIMAIDKKKSVSLLRYYSEMTRVLREELRVLKPGKTTIMVVGNSYIRGVDAEIPYCLSEIGKSMGFRVPAIGVRQLDRNKRMLPASSTVDLSSRIQQRMHEEFIIGFVKS